MVPYFNKLRIAIATTASPDEVFAAIERLRSAPPTFPGTSVRIGVPTVSTRPPTFMIRAQGMAYKAPIGWVASVHSTTQGSLIIAQTDRSNAGWAAAAPLVFLTAVVIVNRNSDVRFGNPAVALAVFAAILIPVGWYRTTHLSDYERRKALALRDLLLSTIPDASLVPVPDSMRAED